MHRTPYVEGYCSRQSVKAGERLDIMVSTSPVQSFKIDIYRTGYYGGTGARLLQSLGPFPGKEQPTPSPGEKNIAECAWDVTTGLTIPGACISGVYLGKLRTLQQGEDVPYWESYIIL